MFQVALRSCIMADGIQISESLILQLVGDDEKSKRKTKPKTPGKPHSSPKRPHQKQIANKPETQKRAPSAEWPLQSPLFFPTPELESVQSVFKESENILQKAQKHEENMVKKVTERAKELHEKEFKLPQQKTVICQIEKNACLECYKEYVNDPLICSTVVSSYQECVRRARKQV
ncbi:hypothetical protein KSS87_000208 [Heliosperma pusillum]|nr:hypothetical protein KSS87_000208 [Heliosperma pusillum]